MKRLLERVGIPDNVMKMIPNVVAQCAVCRAWQRPEPSNQTAINIADQFNQVVEIDIIFWGEEPNTHMIFHMIDLHAMARGPCYYQT